MREARTVVVVYLGTLAHAYSYGFSAVAIPDIKSEMRKLQLISYVIETFKGRIYIFCIFLQMIYIIHYTWTKLDV